jgi:hypothetical protein
VLPSSSAWVRWWREPTTQWCRKASRLHSLSRIQVPWASCPTAVFACVQTWCISIEVAGREECVFSTKKNNVSFCWVGFERMHPLRCTLSGCHLVVLKKSEK